VDGQLHGELLEIRRRLQQRYGLDNLIGFGPAHRRLIEQVRLAASSTVPVLIVGEPGTGRRQVARTIHQLGSGWQRPLVAFDCAALPAEILERELFGAADPDAPGIGPTAAPGGTRKPRLSLGDGSSLLIDEILSLPRDLQARLTEALDAPVRLLATTTGEPEPALAAERLRPELYSALTTLVLRLPPLRHRRDELPALAQHLLERVNQRGGEQRIGFLAQAITTLCSYDWPGNLTELARVVEYAHAHAPGTSRWIGPDNLPATIRGHLGAAYSPPAVPPNPIQPLDDILTEVERRLIETALRQSRSNKSRAAEILGISRPRLYRRIKELNLPDDEPADEAESPG
jgi:DNA-binding NtrC family response regulator